jgi:hypothetical protein
MYDIKYLWGSSVEEKLDIICWRIGLREAYDGDMITSEEFLSMYDRSFMYKEFLSDKEAEIVKYITNLLSDVDGFGVHLKSEMPFIFGGEIPKDKLGFKKHWLFHLAECMEEGHIDDEDFSNLMMGIDFSNPEWTEDETMKVNTILDMLRIAMLVRVPASMDFFENPSFEILMFANDMDMRDD